MKYRVICPLIFILLFTSISIAAASERTKSENIPYYPEKTLEKADDYQKKQCLLDVSYPKNAEKLPVLLWFHGGGLSGGSKSYPHQLLKDEIVLIGVGYRLSPKAKFPDFLEDVAAATAWAFENAEKYGGDPEKIFIGGYSAGGYLSAMIGLDPKWLKPYEIDNKKLAGIISLSGQMTTHFNVRKILNYSQAENHPIIDENAPMFHLSKEAPPILLTLGDRKIEWPARVEENELMAASLRAMKHPNIEFHENPGYDHGSVGGAPEVYEQIRKFIEKHNK